MNRIVSGLTLVAFYALMLVGIACESDAREVVTLPRKAPTTRPALVSVEVTTTLHFADGSEQALPPQTHWFPTTKANP